MIHTDFTDTIAARTRARAHALREAQRGRRATPESSTLDRRIESARRAARAAGLHGLRSRSGAQLPKT